LDVDAIDFVLSSIKIRSYVGGELARVGGHDAIAEFGHSNAVLLQGTGAGAFALGFAKRLRFAHYYWFVWGAAGSLLRVSVYKSL
jgi:hypothetical protein